MDNFGGIKSGLPETKKRRKKQEVSISSFIINSVQNNNTQDEIEDEVCDDSKISEQKLKKRAIRKEAYRIQQENMSEEVRNNINANRRLNYEFNKDLSGKSNVGTNNIGKSRLDISNENRVANSSSRLQHMPDYELTDYHSQRAET